MPIRGPTFPSFTLALSSSRRDSFTLPDYYRTTRLEMYGPYFRTPEPAEDLMKTIDHRGRESVEFDPNFFLPDEYEEYERGLNEIELDGRFERENIEPVRNQVNEGQRKGFAWFWRLISSTLRKRRSHKP